MQGRRAVIVAGAGAAILGLLLVFFLVLPKMNEVAQAREELEDTRAQQQTLSAQLNALEQARDTSRLPETPSARPALHDLLVFQGPPARYRSTAYPAGSA